ncbi:glycosyltransferase family 9 protein [Saccharicrinis fermentans]|uniref:ADP-heptose-LPS heptosyltransferase 2 n=1 Tax=Saccharicrinis fermentans DSM 9555 = JCM 21142 TaxID=869213 RepID=W7Y2M9_9BACT|nr:glycosyltransferase family 9 protein [Saccharicrinis fermentans]GAF01818.1 ADP-heptose-LPS heptosyltransferase 2 [Saccharicrinis fermentans DSM 9555 = JCM 21142]
MEKILIIRLSSIGDIIQCMSITGGFKNHHPNAEVHWIVRKDLASLLKIDPRIDRLIAFDREEGIGGLIKLAFQLKKEKYTHVYDAHSNIRSNILKAIICPPLTHIQQITRKKSRLKRILLFNFRINLLPKPFRAFESFRKPLIKWGIHNFFTPQNNWVFPTETEDKCRQLLKNQPAQTITLVPSAAWELKRWPVSYWKKLIELLPDFHFTILAGPQDNFCNDIAETAPEQVLNLAGKTSLLESFCVTSKAQYVVSGDTGFLHAADLFNVPGCAIIGPTAFGYPTGEKMKIFDLQLPCQPCSKHGNTKCKLQEIKKCLVDITPEQIVEEIKKNISVFSKSSI